MSFRTEKKMKYIDFCFQTDIEIKYTCLVGQMLKVPPLRCAPPCVNMHN